MHYVEDAKENAEFPFLENMSHYSQNLIEDPHVTDTHTHTRIQTVSYIQAQMRHSQVSGSYKTSVQRLTALSFQAQLHTLTLIHTNEDTQDKVAATLLDFESVPELQRGGAVMERDRFRSVTHSWDEYRSRRREDAACWRERTIRWWRDSGGKGRYI